jgi:signal transduction histidine kinase
VIASSRTARIAAVCFALVAALVLGGLSWATVVSLRLKAAQAQAAAEADYNRRLRLALWRMDPLVMNVLAKEASRPYWYYSAYFYAPKAMLTTGEDLTGSVIQPSPLLDRQGAEEWVVLHFQISARTGWSSPQLPSADAWWVGDRPANPADETARRSLLASLDSAFSYADFAALVAQAESAAEAESRWMTGQDRADVIRERGRQSQVTQAGVRPPQPGPQQEAVQRSMQNILVQEANRPPQACDPLDVAIANLHNVITADVAGGSDGHTSYVSVTVSPMIALWMDMPARAGPLLAMVRTVEAEGSRVYQGFVVDWSRLKALLVDTVSDLFDSVDVEVIRPGDTHDPQAILASIPARLVSRPVAAVRLTLWSGLDGSLLLAWGAAFAALAAVGLGVRSLLQMSERRSQFAYAVTHELRTPLTTLCLYTDMLSGGLVREESRAEYLNALRDESQRLADLVSGILEYSRVENQTLRLDTQSVPVARLLETVRERYEPRCRKAGVELVTRAEGLDEEAVHTDPQLVVQIVGNLIDNACKYASSGARPQVCLRAERHDGCMVLEISDTGPGIARRDRRRIFKPFRRGESDGAHKAGGVGLGLALARSWARLLGGRLDLMPAEPGRGARFRLTLPI